MLRFFAGTCAVLGSLLFVNPASACSSCGCTFNSEWASEGYSFVPGLRLDARFDYIDQNQLRHGSHSVSKGSLEFPNEEEIQRSTITRETLLGADYLVTQDWGVRLLVPILDRTHTTITPGETELSSSGNTGVGDISLIARYQGFTPLKKVGVQLGVKLPTGEFTENFDSGPEEGERLDRGLQLGTGTTDLIFGVYNYGEILPRQLEYFLSVNGVQPFAERDGFILGTSVTASTGLSAQVTEWLRPQLQVNYQFEAREFGENSDRDNSGGNSVFLTPGVTINVGTKLNLFALLQVPLYQQVNGLQLKTQVLPSFGVRYLF